MQKNNGNSGLLGGTPLLDRPPRLDHPLRTAIGLSPFLYWLYAVRPELDVLLLSLFAAYWVVTLVLELLRRTGSGQE